MRVIRLGLGLSLWFGLEYHNPNPNPNSIFAAEESASSAENICGRIIFVGRGSAGKQTELVRFHKNLRQKFFRGPNSQILCYLPKILYTVIQYQILHLFEIWFLYQ